MPAGDNPQVSALDEVLPDHDHREHHARVVHGDPSVALAVFLATPAAPNALVGVLLRLRGTPTRVSVEGLLTKLGFRVLHRSATEVVIGAAGKPWTVRGGIHALADARPGEVRVVVNARAEPAAGGRALLSTETRIAAVDEHARRAFGRYWRVVGPFSGLIRRAWLRQTARELRRGVAREHVSD